MKPDDLARALAQPGRASVPYLDRYSPDRPLALECFRPQAHNPDKPVVIVQHGASRNGAEYCEAWISAAERHGLLIVAITFSKEPWPDAVTYNNGHVLDEDGSLRPRECWSQGSPAASLGYCAKQASPGATRPICGVIRPADNSSIGCWRRSRLAFSRQSEPRIPGGTHCRRSTFSTPTGSAASGWRAITSFVFSAIRS